MLLAIISHLRVNLVRHDCDIGKARETLHQFIDLGFRRYAACRVGGRIDNQQPRLRCDEGERLLRREGKAILLTNRHGYGFCAGKLDHRAINRKARIGVENFGARLAKHEDSHEHRHFAARHNHHELGRHFDIEALMQVSSHRLTQRENTCGGRIAMVPVPQRLNRRLNNILGRAEIGLADAKIDDVLALALQFRGASENGKGIFFSNSGEGFDDVQHGHCSCAEVAASRLLISQPI